jgi:hypothetical protein
MANPSARSIAPAPTLSSGSPSNLRVRSSRRTAESRYLPHPRVAPAGRSPAASRTRRRTAPGSPLLSVGVPPVLPSSTSPLLPTILTPSRCAPRSTGEAVLGTPQSLALHTASYTGWVFRSTYSSANLRDRAKYDGARIRFHATFLPPMLQIQVQEEIVEPTSRNEVRFLRSRHLQLGEADWLICSQAARRTACREPEATKERL